MSNEDIVRTVLAHITAAEYEQLADVRHRRFALRVALRRPADP